MAENISQRQQIFSQEEIISMADPNRQLSSEELKRGERQKIVLGLWVVGSGVFAVLHLLANAPR